jgi:glutaredoxin
MYTVYGKPSCPACDSSKKLLESRNINYKYVDVTKEPSARELFVSNGWKSFPQILFQETYVGGLQQLKDFLSLDN